MRPPAALEAVRRYVRTHRDQLRTPGLALALTDRHGCLGVLTEGFANVDAGLAVQPEHRFQIGSISKGFTAIALLQEREAGRLDLDAPVTEYLPWFRVSSAFEPITVHHLLSHTSGIVAGTEFTGEAACEVFALRDTVTGFAPGERFLYSNVGYKTLGLILERLTGRPWWEVVRDRVMEPIGMGTADVVITDASRERLAVGYAGPFDDRPWLSRHGWAPTPWYESGTADGTVCATAEELTAYARALLNGVPEILEPESFALLTSPIAADPDAPEHVYGYGVKTAALGGRRLLGHSGGMVGFTAYLLVDPAAGVGVTVLMNSAFGERLGLVTFALEAMRAEADGGPAPEPPAPADPLRIQDAAAFEGPYEDEAGRIEIVPHGAGLALVDGDATGPLLRLERDRFAVDHPALERSAIWFLRDGNVISEAFWGERWLTRPRHTGERAFEPVPWSSEVVGHYRSWNPWAPSLRVTHRRGELWIEFPDGTLDVPGERPLTALADGSFRVGEDWSPDRIRFDTVIDGRATRALFDGAPFYRTFTV